MRKRSRVQSKNHPVLRYRMEVEVKNNTALASKGGMNCSISRILYPCVLRNSDDHLSSALFRSCSEQGLPCDCLLLNNPVVSYTAFSNLPRQFEELTGILISVALLSVSSHPPKLYPRIVLGTHSVTKDSRAFLCFKHWLTEPKWSPDFPPSLTNKAQRSSRTVSNYNIFSRKFGR